MKSQDFPFTDLKTAILPSFVIAEIQAYYVDDSMTVEKSCGWGWSVVVYQRHCLALLFVNHFVIGSALATDTAESRHKFSAPSG